MIRTLLRLPSPGWESDLATGIESIDNYLKSLDRGLVGSKSVRRLTLLEAKDFLLEAAENVPTEKQDQAIAAAAEAFGKPDDVARRQRSELFLEFGRSAPFYGLGFATWMFIINYFGSQMTDVSWSGIVGMFVFNAFFFGTFMGFCMTFCYAQSLPDSDDASEQTTSFVVSLPRSSIVAGWAMIVLFGIISLTALLGLAGVGLFGAESFAFNVMLSVVGLWLVAKAAASLLFKIHVNEADFVIQSWRGLTRIPFNQVSGFAPESQRYMVFPSVAGAPFRLKWLDQNGREKSTMVGFNAELKNADRFQALLEQTLEYRRQSTLEEIKEAVKPCD
ncbi:MAG: hypothetical protein V2J42_04280 [Wenzhouxiangella sp.]|jgi:hypothetical protein|nr:hypothetical protein [Wenzhouxiangella sp.]